MRIYLTMISTLLLISCVENQKLIHEDIARSNQAIYIHNINTINSGFKELSIINNQIYFNDNFIDGALTSVKYNNKSITINNCEELNKYRIAEIEGIILTDVTIMRNRKRTCNLISHIEKSVEGTDYKLVLNHKPNSNLLTENIIRNILLSIDQDPKDIKCYRPSYNILSSICENKSKFINITPVLDRETSTVYFIDVEYGKMHDLYTVTVSSQGVKVKLEL